MSAAATARRVLAPHVEDASASAPHSVEAEQSALACVLLDNAAFAAVDAALSVGDFYRHDHRLIYEAICQILGAGQVADPITVYARLQAEGRAEQAGGLSYISAVAESLPSARNAAQYAQIVADRARRRDLIAAADELRHAASDPQGRDVGAIAAGAVHRIERAVGNGVEALPSAWNVPAPATPVEWNTAPLAPRCIVENYLFADVATLIAPGGTGKTTATLYEAACIVLGRPVWGLRVREPGPVVIVTAEDRKALLIGRLREVCRAMRLTPAETDTVREYVLIDDRTTDLRRLTTVASDVVTPTAFASEIVAQCWFRGLAPALVQFDPMVSFGVGEARVNDAEQGLIEAARIIVAGIDCCVRYVHHSGKGPALDKRSDQYSGRGGSALADGSRMVAVMQAVEEGELARATGETLTQGQSAFVLHRPKVSYAPPQASPLYVLREGYRFDALRNLVPRTDAERDAASAEQIARYLAAELADGRRHTRNTLEAAPPGNLGRNDMRRALAWLEARGRLVVTPILTADGKPPKTGARYFLTAVERRPGGEAQS